MGVPIANEGHAHLYNVTISGNSATTGGGGITQWNDGDLAIYNTTIANNMSQVGLFLDGQSVLTRFSTLITPSSPQGKEPVLVAMKLMEVIIISPRLPPAV